MNWTKEQPLQPGVYGAIDKNGETAFIFLSHIDNEPYVLAVYGAGVRHNWDAESYLSRFVLFCGPIWLTPPAIEVTQK